MAVAGLCISESMGSIIKRDNTVNEALSGATAVSHPSAAATPAAKPTANANFVAPAAASTPASTPASSAPVDISRLKTIGFAANGQNANSNNGQCWLGSDGPNVNTLKNAASVPVIAVVWGNQGSWMTGGTPPLITVGLAPGASQAVSCADISGGIAGVYPDTKLTPFGQIQQTWEEFTFGSWGTVDISREVYMGGNPLSVVGSKCAANMNQCVFTCKNGASTCFEAGTYQINNCGADVGGQQDAAMMNGGCLMGPNAVLTTTFS